ncbi:MAG: sucB [Microbacteriaceae bacterium]|jgi:pyruvate dehydrogenase E2 component (dihydrolipoamide acetyltransferase)|nr:sucB [Microbacteriaceae bacterium]
MSESVNLPALGESVTEGTVTRWLKNVGDRVEVDEPLLEVSTDKVDTEIPSPVAGVIEAILVAEDETVEVGTALVTIGTGEAPAEPEAPAEEAPAEEAPSAGQPAAEESTEVPSVDAPVPAQQPAEAEQAPEPAADVDEAPAEAAPSQEAAAQAAPAASGEATPAPAGEQAPAAAAPAPSTEPEAPVAAGTTATNSVEAAAALTANAGYVTPIVRKLANDRGVDLSTVSGTGVGGRIRKQDVLAAAVAAPAVAEAAPATPALETSPLRGTTVPMSRLRKVIAERAVISMQASAQLTSVVEVDVTKVAAFRDKVKADFQEKAGVKLSFLPFFALAAAEALKAYPIVNATIDGDTIVYPAHENISIAVDTERGLLTPVIKDAASLDLAGIATQIADLAARTRDNKLKPDELAGGTFTLTNTGSRGALFDTPIVFLPQSAILGTGIVAKKAVVVSHDGTDSIAIRSMVYLALSYDHRIVDGADAARFLVAVKNRLEGGDFASVLGV